MFVFQRTWRALFSLNTRFEIRPFALLPTKSCFRLKGSTVRIEKFENTSEQKAAMNLPKLLCAVLRNSLMQWSFFIKAMTHCWSSQITHKYPLCLISCTNHCSMFPWLLDSSSLWFFLVFSNYCFNDDMYVELRRYKDNSFVIKGNKNLLKDCNGL